VHVLTKIFIVLVSMLAVFLVPLVVVYANNEDSFRAKYADAVVEAKAANQRQQAQALRHQAEVSRLSETIAVQDERLGELQVRLGDASAEVAGLESDLAQANSFQGDVSSKLAVLSSAMESSQQVTQSLLSEVSQLRADNLRSERQIIELDESLRETLLSLQEAEEARRALEEEVTRLSRINDEQLSQLLAYQQEFGDLDQMVGIATLGGGLRPTKRIDANVLSVSRTGSGESFVEIDAGSRDGVEMDWVLTVKQDGHFVAIVRIVEVDINRSVGEVTLQKIPVAEGQQAFARPDVR